MESDVFVYDRSLTYLQNFLRWRELNDIEHEYFKERQFTVEESEVLFSELYGDYK